MIRSKLGKLVLGGIFSGLFATAMAGDILLIEKVEERMLRDLPGNGLSMSAVERRYGQPNARYAPVGDPPITRWDYDDYSVFFEYELVIESVVHSETVLTQAETRQSDP